MFVTSIDLRERMECLRKAPRLHSAHYIEETRVSTVTYCSIRNFMRNVWCQWLSVHRDILTAGESTLEMWFFLIICGGRRKTGKPAAPSPPPPPPPPEPSLPEALILPQPSCNCQQQPCSLALAGRDTTSSSSSGSLISSVRTGTPGEFIDLDE